MIDLSVQLGFLANWAPEIVIFLLVVPVVTACRIESIGKNWGTLSRLRLSYVDPIERHILPRYVGNCAAVAVVLGVYSLFGGAYPEFASEWIKAIALGAYLIAAYAMIGMNATLISKTILFIQASRRKGVTELLKDDLDQLFRKHTGIQPETRHAPDDHQEAPISLPRASFTPDGMKAPFDVKAVIDYLSGGAKASRLINTYKITFLTICVGLPVFVFLSVYGYLAQDSPAGPIDLLHNSMAPTIDMIFSGSTKNAFIANAMSGNPFFELARFAFFFTLALATLRYLFVMTQYKVLGWRRQDSGLGLEVDAVSKLGSFFVILMSTLIALLILRVNFAQLGLLTGFVAAGLSIALRDSLGNLMAGMQLIWDRSLKKGDVISIPASDSRDTGSTYGIVEQIRMRYTVVQDRNTVRRLIPNHLLTAGPIEHWTHEDNKVRLSLRIGIAYHEAAKLREAQKLMEAVCYDVKRVLTEKPPQALLVEYGESEILFSLRFWLDDARDGIRPVISEVLLNLYERLEDAKIRIPFPQRDLHIRSVVGTKGEKDLDAAGPRDGFSARVDLEGPNGRTTPA